MNSDQKDIFHPADGREAAINNLGGMVWLYEKHFSKFKATYADSAESVRNYLMHGKTDEARILIHSIKGLAGTLGMRQLYYAASDLEKAIIATAPSINTAIAVYDSCLKEAITSQDKD